MKNFLHLGKIELGNLKKIHDFVNHVFDNINKIDFFPNYTEIHTNFNLDAGKDLVCMKYGSKNMFYTIKGEKLKDFFDDWESIQKCIEKKVGKTVNNFPLLTLCQNHIFRHQDLKRNASVNLGLLNTEYSTTCIWEKNILVEHINYENGEAILLNVKKEHSVIINDSPSFWKRRSILMWTIEKSYEDLFELYRN